jgi:hypothetical protein
MPDDPLPSRCTLQASWLELLLRITVGSLVVYEADPVKAEERGARLVGVVLEDKGPPTSNLTETATYKQFKARGPPFFLLLFILHPPLHISSAFTVHFQYFFVHL